MKKMICILLVASLAVACESNSADSENVAADKAAATTTAEAGDKAADKAGDKAADELIPESAEDYWVAEWKGKVRSIEFDMGKFPGEWAKGKGRVRLRLSTS